MKDFKDRAERAKDRKWRTGLILVLDEDGKVWVDNSSRNFMDKIDHPATTNDAIYMLQSALDEFHVERTADIVVKRLQALMDQAAKKDG